MTVSQKNLGSLLVGFSIILLIILAIVKVNIDKEESFLCEIVHATPGVDIEQCPAHESSNSWLLILAFVMAFLVLASGFYLIFSTMKIQPEIHAKHVDTSKFDSEEKKIYELLNQNNGSLYQSDLIKETGFSKVKITRIIDKMESRGIVERKRRGMTNIVVLK